METQKLIREVETEEFIDSTIDEEAEIFERKEKKTNEKMLIE